MSDEKECLVQRVKDAKQDCCYFAAADRMLSVVRLGIDLNKMERKLFAEVYKDLIAFLKSVVNERVLEEDISDKNATEFHKDIRNYSYLFIVSTYN